MLTYIEFVEVNCKLVLTSPVGRELVEATKGNLCVGCFYAIDRSCHRRPAGVEINGKPVPSVPQRKFYEETVKQEAARRRVSISQVRRERAEQSV